MKKLFTVIRQGRLDEVARILDKNPDLLNALGVFLSGHDSAPCNVLFVYMIIKGDRRRCVWQSRCQYQGSP